MLAGVCVTFPSTMPGSIESFPRTTDVLNLVSAGLLFSALFMSSLLHRAVYGILLVWVMTLPWVFMEICALAGAPDPPVQRLLIRWILCGFSAYLITAVAEKPVLRAYFLYGLLAGVIFSLLTVFYDFLTFSPANLPIEELVNLAITNDSKDIYDFAWRAYGIFGHPNGAAGCVLVGVPLIIGAIQEGRLPRWSMLFALALMVSVFYLTKSRGPLVVSVALIAFWIWSQTAGLRLLIVFAGLVAMLGVLAAGGLRTGWSGNDGVLLARFLDLDSISINVGDRWWTIATSLDLMLRNPLGMGSAYIEPLEIATGTRATHLAYFELALMGGIALMAFVVIRLVGAATLLLTPWRPVEAWLAAYLLGIFAFESYFLQVNIQLMTLWLVISPLRSSIASQAASRAGTPGKSLRGQGSAVKSAVRGSAR
ncbi:MAG: hypothetical protein U1E21_18285 [Reyranellaceae bacterium]